MFKKLLLTLTALFAGFYLGKILAASYEGLILVKRDPFLTYALFLYFSFYTYYTVGRLQTQSSLKLKGVKNAKRKKAQKA
jgi:hypothetical protein